MPEMDNDNDFITISSADESLKLTPGILNDGSKGKEKATKHDTPTGKSTYRSKYQQPRKFKCSRDDEHTNPSWLNHDKPIYAPPVISSFLIIDIQKIFRNRFRVPVLDRITRSEGIELLAELLGMHDMETNIISYWTLDVLSQVIKKCQSISMKEQNIKMCILWIHFILYTIHKNHLSRYKMFKLLCIMFNRAVWKLPELVVIPHPYHLKQRLDKEKAARAAMRKAKEIYKVNINQDDDYRRISFEDEGLEEEFIDFFEEEGEEHSPSEDDSSTEVEEEESDCDDVAVELSNHSIKNEKDEFEDFDQLPKEALDLPDETKEKLYYLANEINEIRKNNKRDFFLLIRIIYRIFGNRFKYTVIWEAFARPPRPKIIGIGNNIKTPKKIKIIKPVAKNKQRASIARGDKKPKTHELQERLSATESSLVRKLFPPMKKKTPKKKKKSRHIRPLAEAVSKKFFNLIADHKYKEVRYAEYNKRMEAIRQRLNIKGMDDKKLKVELKALIAKYKKKKNTGHKGQSRYRMTRL